VRHVVRDAAEWDANRREAARDEEAALFECRKPRKHERDLVAERPKRLRQRSSDVGQPADFDERRELGRDEENVHERRVVTCFP
jgi:hypothetical protein